MGEREVIKRELERSGLLENLQYGDVLRYGGDDHEPDTHRYIFVERVRGGKIGGILFVPSHETELSIKILSASLEDLYVLKKTNKKSK